MKTSIKILTLVVIVVIAGYFMFFPEFRVSRITTDTDHKISATELKIVKDFFQKNNIDLNNLQIFKVTMSKRYDSTTIFHVRVNQFYRGLPIFDNWITYHFLETGEIQGDITGERFADLDISIDPKVTIHKAVKISKTKMRGHNYTAELGIYRPYPYDQYGKKLPDNFFLAWQINSDNPNTPAAKAYVDANTGELLYYFSGIVN